jgi:hypothetical protein
MSGGGARNGQRGRLETVFDPEPGDAEGHAADEDDEEAENRLARPPAAQALPRGRDPRCSAAHA